MTSSEERKEPFLLRASFDQDELLGARWWHQGLTLAATAERGPAGALADRRAVLRRMVVIGGGLLATGVIAHYVANLVTETDVRDSLELQRQSGLFVGAGDAEFTYPDAVSTAHDGEPLTRAPLDRLGTDLRPANPTLQVTYSPTLFSAFRAYDRETFTRGFRMIRSTAMQRAFWKGQTMRELLEQAPNPATWALVVDLPGPESVAFAAGLQPFCTAVFTFANWPHPRGVVPAHLTLAATVYYRATFAEALRALRRPAVFVLDRNRLAPYRDAQDLFDNRYAVNVPTVDLLRERGVERVLYVVPAGVDPVELDDLNERFVEYRSAGVAVHMLGLGDLRLSDPTPIDSASGDWRSGPQQRRYYWLGDPLLEGWFWYRMTGVGRPTHETPRQPPTASFGSTYTPMPRRTLFGGTGIASLGKTRLPRAPSGRSGSWGRSGAFRHLGGG
jgi:hypothetical protein